MSHEARLAALGITLPPATAPAFDYVRPNTLAEALALLREHGEDAKIIAGGQSLVPPASVWRGAPDR